MPRVLCRDEVHRAQCFQCAQRDVTQVSNGRRDEKKHGRENRGSTVDHQTVEPQINADSPRFCQINSSARPRKYSEPMDAGRRLA